MCKSISKGSITDSLCHFCCSITDTSCRFAYCPFCIKCNILIMYPFLRGIGIAIDIGNPCSFTIDKFCATTVFFYIVTIKSATCLCRTGNITGQVGISIIGCRNTRRSCTCCRLVVKCHGVVVCHPFGIKCGICADTKCRISSIICSSTFSGGVPSAKCVTCLGK